MRKTLFASLIFVACAFSNGFAQQLTPPPLRSTSAAKPEVKLDSKILERYVGSYEYDPFLVVTVTRDQDRLFAQSTGGPKVELAAEKENNFFYKVIDGTVIFQIGSDNKPVRLTINIEGRSLIAKRIESPRVNQLAADWTKRIDSQSPLKGGEQAVREILEGITRNAPNYDKMTPTVASMIKRQLTMIQSAMASNGALKEVKFLGVTPTGADVYETKFENRLAKWGIIRLSNGVVSSFGFIRD